MISPKPIRTPKKATRRSRAPGAFNQSTREVLLQQAENIVAERGITEFKLTELATRLGMNVSSIFSHFPGGRRELIDELASSFVPTLINLMPEAESGDPEVLLADGVATLVLHLADHPGQARIMLLDLSIPRGLVAVTREIGTYGESLSSGGLSQMAHRLELILQRGHAAAKFRKVDARDVFQLMVGMALMKVVDPEMRRSTAVRTVTDAVLRFVRA
jgi:AcrR family transcriptional regulator